MQFAELPKSSKSKTAAQHDGDGSVDDLNQTDDGYSEVGDLDDGDDLSEDENEEEDGALTSALVSASVSHLESSGPALRDLLSDKPTTDIL
jgi:hypothetical protein